MKSHADINFSTVTELADELVRKEGISFRSAHQIVGEIVKNCIDSGLCTKDITTKMLDEAGEKYEFRSFNWTQDYLNSILDATYSVSNKLSMGSPAPDECQRMIENLTLQLDRDKEAYRNLVRELEQSKNRLYEEVNRIII